MTTTTNALPLFLLLALASTPLSVDGFSANVVNNNVATPPMPFVWPVLGTLPDFVLRGGADNLRDVYEDMYKEYGSVYGMSILGDDELVLSDPQLYESVALKKEGKFPIGGSESVSTFTDYYKENNLTFALRSVSRGPEWREWRDTMNPDLYSFYQGYLPLIAEAARDISAVAGREVPDNIPFVDFVSRSAFDMFATVMFGESPQTTDSLKARPEDIEFVRATQTAFDLTGEVLTNPLEKVFGSDTYLGFKENMDKVYGLGKIRTREYLNEALEQQAEPASASEETTSTSTGGGCPVNAVMSKFQTASVVEKMVDRQKLRVEEIAEMGPVLVMAGVDTTAYVLSWLFLNLASNPKVQNQLAEELKEVLQGDDLTTVEQIEDLPYLKACIRESHRLTPPGPIMAKKLEQDVDIAVAEDTTYRVKAGQRISLNLRGFPMDPQYVDQPQEYRPERFLEDAVQSRKGTPSEILDHPAFADPFGRGKRRCLGANIALSEIYILVARLVQDYEISLVDPNAQWKPKQKLMLKADPYPDIDMVPRV